MTLTLEQFNKLATKNEFNKLKTEVGEIKYDVRKILTGVDGLAKIPTPYLLEAIKEADAEIKNGRNYSFANSKEAIKFLDR